MMNRRPRSRTKNQDRPPSVTTRRAVIKRSMSMYPTTTTMRNTGRLSFATTAKDTSTSDTMESRRLSSTPRSLASSSSMESFEVVKTRSSSRENGVAAPRSRSRSRGVYEGSLAGLGAPACRGAAPGEAAPPFGVDPSRADAPVCGGAPDSVAGACSRSPVIGLVGAAPAGTPAFGMPVMGLTGACPDRLGLHSLFRMAPRSRAHRRRRPYHRIVFAFHYGQNRP